MPDPMGKRYVVCSSERGKNNSRTCGKLQQIFTERREYMATLTPIAFGFGHSGVGKSRGNLGPQECALLTSADTNLPSLARCH